MMSTPTQSIRAPNSKLAVVLWILIILVISRLVFDILTEEGNTNTSSSLLITPYCPQVSPLLGEPIYQSKYYFQKYIFVFLI